MAERAEASHQHDFAAHEFFEAAREYQKRGSFQEAEEMRTQELRVLSKIVMLSDSAVEIESQASTLTTHASQVSHDQANDPASPAPELYALAAGLYEEASDHYLALANQTLNAAQKRECLSKAAIQLQRAGRSLVNAVSAGFTAQGEDDARQLYWKELYWKASRLQSQAAEIDEAQPSEAPEVMSTPLKVAWLRKGGRMKCRECERLWKAYTESSQRHAVLSRMQESANSDNEELSRHVAYAAEFRQASMTAVLDHETSHRVAPAGRFGEHRANVLSVVLAS